MPETKANARVAAGYAVHKPQRKVARAVHYGVHRLEALHSSVRQQPLLLGFTTGSDTNLRAKQRGGSRAKLCSKLLECQAKRLVCQEAASKFLREEGVHPHTQVSIILVLD